MAHGIPQEKIQGFVIITTKGSFEHKGISLLVEGAVHMTARCVLLSRSALRTCLPSTGASPARLAGSHPRSVSLDVGLFDSLGQALKPLPLVNFIVQVAKPATLPDGTNEIPFEFTLDALPSTLIPLLLQRRGWCSAERS